MLIVAAGGAALYCVAVTWYLLSHGGWPTPDFLIPPLLLFALLAQRGRAFLVDWAPFLLVLIAWEATRGIADQLGMPVHVIEPVIAERALFFGALPTIELQRWLFDPERGPRWFDWVGAILHSLHFVLPIAVGFGLWLKERALFRRYAVSILLLFLFGFAGYVLFPQAPPWIAGEMGVIPFTYRIGVGALLSLPFKGEVILLYDHIRPNDVAAMPSLHAALPFLLTLILWRLSRPLGIAGAVYTALIAFFLVYQGEHYVVDILPGWALAWLAYHLVWQTPDWLTRWLPASETARRRAVAAPLTAIAALVVVVGAFAVLRPGALGAGFTRMVPAAPDVPPEPAAVQTVTIEGPCGRTGLLTEELTRRMPAGAGEWSAWLIEPDVGVCLALMPNTSLAPPSRDDAVRLALRRNRELLAAPPEIAEAMGARLTLAAIGPAGPRLTAAGVPPGLYLLVVALAAPPAGFDAESMVAPVTEAVFEP